MRAAQVRQQHDKALLRPWIVTRDEIPDVKALTGRAKINGQVFVEADFSDALHSFPDMITFVSRDETLYAGEVFGSGTVGNGCGLERFEFFADGDVLNWRSTRLACCATRSCGKTARSNARAPEAKSFGRAL
jgi:2-keto-4-pentenoate hydratase/2-oxohepta-3-ene-1,7-dioic acid hydratase in catechol pathway